MAKIIFWNTFNKASSIFLLRPPGPHILNSWLSHNGHHCKVLDFCSYFTTNELVALTEKFITSETVAIGVSTTFWKAIDAMFSDQQKGKYSKIVGEPEWVIGARKILQSRYPHLKWITGGANTYYFSEYQWLHFDGKCEDQILKFLDESSTKKFDILKSRQPYHVDMGISKNETLSVELSRGCQFICKFCGYDLIGKKPGTYTRNMDGVYRDFIENYENFGITRYSIVDDTFNESEEKIVTLAKIAQKLPFKLEWVGYNRLDLIGSKPHIIELLEQSGLRGTFFGIESFHPGASKTVGKGWNGKYGKDFLLELRERWNNKIHFTLGFIAGLPYEPFESIRESHKWCIDNKISYWHWVGLQLDRNKKLSIFEKDHLKYNIKFTHPLKPTHWEHDICNFDEAQTLALSLNRDPERWDIVRPSMWDWATYTPLGYTFDDLYELSSKTLMTIKSEIEEKSREFLKNYLQFQLNL